MRGIEVKWFFIYFLEKNGANLFLPLPFKSKRAQGTLVSCLKTCYLLFKMVLLLCSRLLLFCKWTMSLKLVIQGLILVGYFKSYQAGCKLTQGRFAVNFWEGTFLFYEWHYSCWHQIKLKQWKFTGTHGYFEKLVHLNRIWAKFSNKANTFRLEWC